MSAADYTVAQRALLRRLADDTPPRTFVFLSGADARVASHLASVGLVFLGVRHARDPKGLPARLTDEGRLARATFAATGRQDGLVEGLLSAMNGGRS